MHVVLSISRSFIAVGAVAVSLLSGCGGTVEPEETPFADAVAQTGESAAALVSGFTREVVAGDIVHYTIDLDVGSTPNARLRIHRVVRERSFGIPRRTAGGVMMMHGDFATFVTSFAPGLASDATDRGHGMAPYLAGRGLDVWGFDRRWTNPPVDGADVSDFVTMGFAEEVGDIAGALAFARAARLLGGAGAGRLTLAGFSHGAQLAYEYAGVESQKPAWQRHVKNLVPIDMYARLAPDDEDIRQLICDRIADEQGFFDQGYLDSDNLFFREMGALANEAPLDPSPYFDDLDNQHALLYLVGLTGQFYPATPSYHLAGTVITDGLPASLGFSSQGLINDWFANAAPHQSWLETVDGDRLWCGEAPLPLPDHYADIQVPLYYLGAAGGYGDHGLHSTTLVGSSDVTTHVVRLLDPANEAEDFGHGDLLFANDAETLAWEPLADWILDH